MRHHSHLLSLPVVFLLAACGSGDSHPGAANAVGSAVSANVPDDQLAGLANVRLVPAEGAINPSDAPAGTFWYRVTNGALEWFVRARQLTGGRYYRVEITTDERARYAIGSLRADSSGALAGRGVLTSFADRVCVGGDAAPPQPLNDARSIRVALKEDGSGGRSGSLTSPSGNLPCAGNGDGKWDYVLVQHDAAPLLAGGTRSSTAP